VIESELFGHVIGAFTGASRDKAGLLEVSDQGTVFMDEIGEMPLELQARLLRFLESGEIRRVGANRAAVVDTRVVAATNRNLESLRKGEGFREDLYFRLAHAVVALPPLRRRGEDIDLLVDHFLAQTCAEEGKAVRLSTEARNRLVACPWLGNVRELRAEIRRLVLLTESGSEIGKEAVRVHDSNVAGSLTEELEQTERRKIVEALAQTRGDRTAAARLIGMSRTTMIGKMKRYGIR
jgi:transcriptional regulator with PAS, ATPase and Fis domain